MRGNPEGTKSRPDIENARAPMLGHRPPRMEGENGRTDLGPPFKLRSGGVEIQAQFRNGSTLRAVLRRLDAGWLGLRTAKRLYSREHIADLDYGFSAGSEIFLKALFEKLWFLKASRRSLVSVAGFSWCGSIGPTAERRNSSKKRIRDYRPAANSLGHL